ncbi:MAG: gamma-mobile-trio protein GmtX [Pseudobdellovibrionaceae bacterium]
MTPEETLNELKKKTNSRSHRTLDAIYEVCEEQLQKGMTDFSIPNIANLGQKRGVPKAQSIRNATGESYKTLIRSFAESTASKKSLNVKRMEDDWIERISDPNTKLLVRKQAAELTEMKKLQKEFLPINAVIEVSDFSRKKESIGLTDIERRALEYLLSPEFQEKEQLTVGKQGQMETADGRIMLRVATIDAIKKALEFL